MDYVCFMGNVADPHLAMHSGFVNTKPPDPEFTGYRLFQQIILVATQFHNHAK